MHLFKKIMVFVFFVILNFSNHDAINTPFSNLIRTTIPFNFETGTIKNSSLIITLSINILLIINIVARINYQFKMSDYLLTRNNHNKVTVYLFSDILKNIGFVLLLKFLSDIPFFKINGVENLEIPIIIYISFILTIAIWIIITYLLFVLKFRYEMSMFLLIAFSIIFQYCAQTNSFFTFLIVGSPTLLEHPAKLLIFKFGVAIFLLFLEKILYNKYEYGTTIKIKRKEVLK